MANVPEIRVVGVDGVQWSQKKCGDLLTERNVQHPQSEEYPLVSFTIEDGVTPKTERYERESLVAGDKNAKKYKETRLNDIVYNPANLKFGAIARNKYGNAVFSPIYVTFDVNENFAVPEFVEVLVSKKDFIQDALQYQKGTVYERMSVCSTDFLNLDVKIPSVAEQRQIGSIFERLDALISQHQHKYEALVAVKKAMLEKMFPREGETVPQIRFAGFADPWEQRKFSDLVLIERGGSPRPIDDYITDAPDGLNWVKIGDAPEQGRYITKTAEKIKPEGLTKTRQVQPGDLILSNSMSFGKPYIMGINGCIHDGWLLIRDTQSRFDLKFLCHMLGTDQMLDQYRMFAAGSTVNNLNKELVGNTTVSLPSIEEQRVIGEYLESIDNIITLHQRKCEVLKNLKSALLNKMFVNTTE